MVHPIAEIFKIHSGDRSVTECPSHSSARPKMCVQKYAKANNWHVFEHYWYFSNHITKFLMCSSMNCPFWGFETPRVKTLVNQLLRIAPAGKPQFRKVDVAIRKSRVAPKLKPPIFEAVKSGSPTTCRAEQAWNCWALRREHACVVSARLHICIYVTCPLKTNRRIVESLCAFWFTDVNRTLDKCTFSRFSFNHWCSRPVCCRLLLQRQHKKKHADEQTCHVVLCFQARWNTSPGF